MANKALLKRIECAYLPVKDVAASAAWYERVLGLKLRSPIEPGRGAIMIMDSGQWLFLLPCGEGHPLRFETTGWTEDGSPFEMFPICFETDDIRGMYEALRQAGAWMEETVRDEGSCGLQLNFKDPDGNKFQVWQLPVAAGVPTP
ncbi:Catechol 2,3-dioxygenase [Paenibacillus sp. UNC496MF]|uniref:VOC family protein n=1 Tax=Paenibacillus sp. UNC496MF TaxID=1502753 RepID=UPI0008E23CEA|nr:VOC family protein [Paenibacillus sp. UNC496MF]SFI40956.1 Catechol 2,3-dioxygenase [Paenibacillus sp. UNC496MF]